MTQDVSPGWTGPHVNAMAIIPGQPDLSWGWLPRVANGPFQSWRYPRIASWGIFSRPCGTGSFCEPLPRTHVLGYSQPSLRDSFGESSSHTPSLVPEVRLLGPSGLDSRPVEALRYWCRHESLENR